MTNIDRNGGGNKSSTGIPAVNSAKHNMEGGTASVNRNVNNEDSCLNPLGWQLSDRNTLKTRCTLLKIDTWNVRTTLFQAEKCDNLCKTMDGMGLDILGGSETRWTDSGKLTENNKVMAYAGGTQIWCWNHHEQS